MDHRNFERDRAASDPYVERLESVYASQLADGDADQARRTLQVISGAATQWLKASSVTMRLGGYFTEKYVVCVRARTKAEDGEWGDKEKVVDGLHTSHCTVSSSFATLRINDWLLQRLLRFEPSTGPPR